MFDHARMIRSGFALLGTALLLTACGGDDGSGPSPDDDPVLTSVGVSPTTGTLASLGATTQLAAAPRDENGAAFSGASVSWSSSAAGVADVDASGLVTAVSEGTTTITATASADGRTVTGTAQITVDQEAATVTLTAPETSLTSGATMQLSATSADANGNALAGATYTFQSSDEGVATVDASGLVTAASQGITTLSASLDGASDTAELTVVVGDVTFSEDATVSGTLEAATLTIEAGVTVTMADDVVINAQDAITLDGSLEGDCVAVAVNGGAGMTMTGTIANHCSAGATGPGIAVQVAGALVMNGATLQSTGDIDIANDGTASASTVGGLAQVADRPCTFQSVLLVKLPNQAGTGMDGSPIGIKCVNDATFVGGNQIQAQDGGDGMNDQVPATMATGGPAGRGGDVLIQVDDGDALFQNNTFGGAQGTGLVSGLGGAGGDADALGVDADPDATANGGTGGNGGDIMIQVPNGTVTIDGLGGLRIDVGDGGRGGDAFASGWDGDDPSENGGAATAKGGNGGDSGLPAIGSSGAPPAGLTNIIQTGGNGGRGGHATAWGGIGADGDATSTPGGEGGDMLAEGGTGGTARDDATAAPRPEGLAAVPLGIGGDGGDANFDFGQGGFGADMCWVGPGGAGGLGGDGTGFAGAGGDGGGFSGTITVADHTGDGGGGGDGMGAGPGGNGGTPNIPTGVGAQWPTAFNPAGPGIDCAVIIEIIGSILSDPSGHEPFIQLLNALDALTARFFGSAVGAPGAAPNTAATGTVVIEGNGNWVAVTGTLQDDGSFSGTGTGTVAGFPNVSVTFTGTIDFDETTGAPVSITGTYTMGAGGELPGGNPAVYTIGPSS